MASQAFEDIVDDFEFIDDWEDRYRYVIELGKAMDDMDDALKVEANKVHGCASQVWLHITKSDDQFSFIGDSDAMIVKGLIAVLQKLYNGLAISDARGVNALEELGRLGLNDHLSAQRSNGLRSMIERITASVA